VRARGSNRQFTLEAFAAWARRALTAETLGISVRTVTAHRYFARAAVVAGGRRTFKLGFDSKFLGRVRSAGRRAFRQFATRCRRAVLISLGECLAFRALEIADFFETWSSTWNFAASRSGIRAGLLLGLAATAAPTFWTQHDFFIVIGLVFFIFFWFIPF